MILTVPPADIIKNCEYDSMLRDLWGVLAVNLLVMLFRLVWHTSGWILSLWAYPSLTKRA